MNFEVDTSNLTRLSERVKELIEETFPCPTPEERQQFLAEVAELERQIVERGMSGNGLEFKHVEENQ